MKANCREIVRISFCVDRELWDEYSAARNRVLDAITDPDLASYSRAQSICDTLRAQIMLWLPTAEVTVITGPNA